MTDTSLLMLIMLAAATLTSCGGHATRDGSAATDTAIADTCTMPEPVKPLPDTIYPSASLINARTRVLDTLVSALIDDYADPYVTAPGTLTFRANRYRDADMHGTVSGNPTAIDVAWTFTTEHDNRETGFGQWGGGTGWTGQPLYIEWPDSCLRAMRHNLHDGFSGREIIVGSLAANIYFIDFESGKPSRQPIAVGNPIKGTVSLDPSLNGLLYLGHGVPAERPFGAVLVDLRAHRVADIYPEDPHASRRWNAYDSSPVRAGRFLFRPGENGLLYKFTVGAGCLDLHSTMTYTAAGSAPGMEASMCIYRNYGYTADNHGYIVCTNLDTMRPVWVYATGDDNDSSPVIAEEDGHPYLYCASEIDRQGTGRAVMAKLDALTGREVWVQHFEGRRFDNDGKHFDGGFYASPLPGKGNCSHLIFNNLVRNTSGQNGEFTAIDRATGSVVYTVPTRVYAWSSPVGFVNEADEMYVLTADCGGYMYLIEGISGRVIDRRAVGANFESSPVVSGNSAVVGSRGNTIYKVNIR